MKIFFFVVLFPVALVGWCFNVIVRNLTLFLMLFDAPLNTWEFAKELEKDFYKAVDDELP